MGAVRFVGMFALVKRMWPKHVHAWKISIVHQ